MEGAKDKGQSKEEGREEGRDAPCMVDFTGLELDLNDLAALKK